ncbi:MAG: HAD family hydrolase [Candidatus Omnitrophica bacterium]|nr:HAD family hydrolase [Candidatus Omnitrophota bacterium]
MDSFSCFMFWGTIAWAGSIDQFTTACAPAFLILTNWAVILDRDGVINRNIDGGYVSAWDEFEFLPDSLDAIAELTRAGFKIIITSNQAGVSKGIYTEKRLSKITANMLDRIEQTGGKIYSVRYCLHKDEDNCICRKPKTGLFMQAIHNIAADLKNTFVVGDSERDIEAGKKIGCKTILVLSGKIKNKKEADNLKSKPDFIAKDLFKAVKSIVIN